MTRQQAIEYVLTIYLMCAIIKHIGRYIVMSEQWKWIIYNGHDFTGKYMVSNHGNIRSVDRFTEKQHQFFKGKIISQRDSSKSHVRSKTRYKTVTLYDDGRSIDIEVHRLVATAFIENPDNKKCVNHKDGNGSNNSAENLEWSTHSENVRHSIDVLGHNPRKWKSKKVLQKTVDGDVIKEWESAWEIQRQLGYCQVSISRCCRREKKSGIMYGYMWDFADERW